MVEQDGGWVGSRLPLFSSGPNRLCPGPSWQELTLLPPTQPQGGSPLFHSQVGFPTSVCLLFSSTESST